MVTKDLEKFKSLNDLIDKFEKVRRNIIFENREYQHSRTTRQGYSSKIVYRNEQEQHNLVIYMMGNVVVKADGIYSIEELAV